MTEHQKFETLKQIGDLEIRRYLPYVTAEVIVEGDMQSAGNKGFRPLANYIFSNGIAMTAPVVIEETDSSHARVSFVMPDQSRIDRMPAPQVGVALRASDGEFCAALSFRGYTSARRVKTMEKKLQELVASAGLKPIGPIRVARFDPPWKPGFARHNEVVLPIESPNL